MQQLRRPESKERFNDRSPARQAQRVHVRKVLYTPGPCENGCRRARGAHPACVRVDASQLLHARQPSARRTRRYGRRARAALAKARLKRDRPRQRHERRQPERGHPTEPLAADHRREHAQKRRTVPAYARERAHRARLGVCGPRGGAIASTAAAGLQTRGPAAAVCVNNALASPAPSRLVNRADCHSRRLIVPMFHTATVPQRLIATAGESECETLPSSNSHTEKR
eukprot:6179559-Pleurochrysis_carterae.AAC.3